MRAACVWLAGRALRVIPIAVRTIHRVSFWIRLPLSLLILGLTAPTWVRAAEIAPPQAPQDVIEFEANQLDYNEKEDVVTARGQVVALRDGQRLDADEVIWNRKTGLVEARGNVRLTDKDGNSVQVDKVELTESLRDGAIENMLLILEDGSRLAARNGRKLGDVTEVERAVYSPCIVCTESGEERPLWRMKAVKVVRDAKAKRIRYRDATFEFLGVPVAYTPYISHADPSVPKASGLLVPGFKHSRALGVSVELPYFINLGPSRDLLLSPIFFTDERPVLGAEYRQFFGLGPVTVGGSVTVAPIRRERISGGGITQTEDDSIRGHFYVRGRFDHSPQWRSTFDSRWTTDDTYMRRYDVSDDDRLRSVYRLERFGARDYLQIETRAFQGLRVGDAFGRAPIVLPGIDYRWLSAPGWHGSRFRVRANALSIVRTADREDDGDLESRDLQRGSLTAGWELPYLNGLGQQWLATAVLRGDVYHSQGQDTGNPLVDVEGTRARILPQAALEMRWPLQSGALGGRQTLTPILQVVASGRIGNRRVPIEDSLSYDLDDLNVFDLNRFPGLDGWENGVRLAYGGEWGWDIGRFDIQARLGQSYRMSNERGVFFDGTGLTGNFSDIVGRTSVTFAERFDLIHRFRVDKNNLSVRRNEIDAVFRAKRFSLGLGYTKLNRDIAALELEDREEARLNGRYQLSRYWSVVGSTILDLTNDVDPIRHRVGVVYEDECFRFGLTYRRNFTSDRDFRRGTTILLQFSLKNLGR
jgi:LPS-assembly protein